MMGCTKLILPPYLEGNSVYLRPFTDKDINPTYLGWLNDSHVVRYSNQRFYQHTFETSWQFWRAFVESTNHFLAICDRTTGAMIGTLTVYYSEQHRTADIGILLGHPEIWRQGIGFDAFRTISQHLEQSGQVRKLTAGTLAENHGMIRIMEKAGFTLEAVRRGQELLENKPTDVVYYARFCRV